MMSTDLSIWEGDGLPDYDEWRDFVLALDMTGPELEAWLKACKSEAWIREHLAKYENNERNLAVARYFRRRVEKLRGFIKKLEQQLDEENQCSSSGS